MGRKKHKALGLEQLFRDGKSDSETVVGRGRAAEFVEEDEAAVGCAAENVGGFAHFDEEGRCLEFQIVVVACFGKESVGDSEAGVFGGDVTSNLGDDLQESDRAEVGRFAASVGARDDLERVGGAGVAVVGHKRFERDLFLDRMAGVFDCLLSESREFN